MLSNEEITPDGKSEIGNFPVFRRNLRQWMMRITSYGDRLIEDLDRLDWPESVKAMQRNWIGRSVGARVVFPVVGHGGPSGTGGDQIEVYTTRPDTLFGATYMVLAPEHPLVTSLVGHRWPDGTPAPWTGGAATPSEAVRAYQQAVANKSDLDRQENKEKTGVFTGAFARNPANGAELPIFIADYVLMGYGTGAIMAVPGPGRARLGICPRVRAADHPYRAAAGRFARGRGVHRRWTGDQQLQRRGLPGRAGRR